MKADPEGSSRLYETINPTKVTSEVLENHKSHKIPDETRQSNHSQ